MNAEFYIKRLEEGGVKFHKGLTAAEIENVESIFHFRFPPDLENWLKFALPVGEKWIDWRKPYDPHIQEAFDSIYQGFYFDIEHNNFWLENWSKKPKDLKESFEIARQAISKVPKLIPIYGHRYIPGFPNEVNNPIFSVHQTDIIYYGNNLWNYFENEFFHCFEKPCHQIDEPIKQIEFWSSFAEELI